MLYKVEFIGVWPFGRSRKQLWPVLAEQWRTLYAFHGFD